MNEFLSVVPNQAWLRKVGGVFLSMGGDEAGKPLLIEFTYRPRMLPLR